MQNEHIFSAPSLSEVMRQLLIYRPTGVLTIWPSVGPRQEDARITIEGGQPIYVIRGSHWEHAGEAILAWLNSWGTLHFSFTATQSHLLLPAPTQQAPQRPSPPPETPRSSTSSIQPGRLPHSAATTQPMQAIPPTNHSSQMPTLSTHIDFERTYELPVTRMIRRQVKESNRSEVRTSSYAPTHERIIASLTPHGKTYPASRLPRYERTIFLLINGRRSVVDLAHLTRRSIEEVHTTLRRLQGLQLITLE